MTKAPATITYASVVTRESVWLALMIAALNNLQVKTGDVLNAYITAQVTERVWMTLGPEWGPDAGKRDLKVPEQHFVHILPNACAILAIPHAKLTPTFGTKHPSDPTITSTITHAFYVTLTTFYASTTMRCRCSTASITIYC